MSNSPSKVQKRGPASSPSRTNASASGSSPARSESGSPASKARKLKGKSRAEPSGKNISTKGMDEAEAIATVKQRIVKYGNLYLGAVKVRVKLALAMFFQSKHLL
jgi:hypothetical protein